MYNKMGIKIHQGSKKKAGMKNKMEAKFLPILSPVFVREQHS